LSVHLYLGMYVAFYSDVVVDHSLVVSDSGWRLAGRELDKFSANELNGTDFSMQQLAKGHKFGRDNTDAPESRGQVHGGSAGFPSRDSDSGRADITLQPVTL
jgi:hypothetical protein